jgi:hypothetical protein
MNGAFLNEYEKKTFDHMLFIKGRNIAVGELFNSCILQKFLLIGFKHIEGESGRIIQIPLVIDAGYGSLLTHSTGESEGDADHCKFTKPPLNGVTYMLPQPSYSVFGDIRKTFARDELKMSLVHLGYEIGGTPGPVEDWERTLLAKIGVRLEEKRTSK